MCVLADLLLTTTEKVYLPERLSKPPDLPSGLNRMQEVSLEPFDNPATSPDKTHTCNVHACMYVHVQRINMLVSLSHSNYEPFMLLMHVEAVCSVM